MTDAELISQFSKLRVLVLGDAILDEYVLGTCVRLSPEAPVPVVRVNEHRSVLGGAANTAANIASLGGHAHLIALVGEDSAGENIVASAASAGIELVSIRDGRPTSRKSRVIGEHQQLVRLDYEDVHPITEDTENEILRLVLERLSSVDIVIMSDYAKGLLTHGICQRLIHETHRIGKSVVIDPRPEHRDFYEHGDYVTPNWQEAQELLKRPRDGQTPDNVEGIGRSLVSILDANVLLTLGANGMAFFGREGRDCLTTPTVAKTVFDVSGAGDTVVAVFALARAAQASNAQAMDLANRAAGLVVGKSGTATVTPEELLPSMIEHPRLVSRDELATLVAGLRTTRKRVTTVNGSFDRLDVGHLRILREASKLGDVLIVGLNSDASLRSSKGPECSIRPQSQRAEMLMALRYVDYVHIFDESAPTAFLDQVRPDVHVNDSGSAGDCLELFERLQLCRPPI